MVINVSCARHRSVQPIIGSYTLAEGSGLPSSYSSFVNNVSLLSELCLFMFQICRNNPTQIDKFFQFTDQDIQVFVAISHRNNIKYCRLFTIIYTVPVVQRWLRIWFQLVSSSQNYRAFAQSLIGLFRGTISMG